MTKKQLIDFENRIKTLFEDGKIKAPIHLSDGNEEQLIEIFKNIKKTDWVFSTWRNHYHALLHGINPEFLFAELSSGNSITFQSPENNFFTSAIVGGIIPIAVGVALALKKKKDFKHVWCFIGDMAAETGIFHEGLKYSMRNKLPITFIIEDNGISVATPTQESWGLEDVSHTINYDSKYVIQYSYVKKYPHVGSGKWVTF